MTRWAQPPQVRDQMLLISVRLDDEIPKNHVVRMLDEILRRLDWSKWEAGYDLGRGQPAIHPRVMASVLLYGLLTRIRSSRALEGALQVRLDYRWLTQGLTIDHSTLCEFRRSHTEELKDLFVKVCEVAQQLGMLAFERLGFDGTRVKANNSRFATKTVEDLKRERDQLKAKLGELLQQAESEDRRDEELFESQAPHEVPKDLQDDARRLAKINDVLRQFDEDEQAGRAVPNRVPTTDLDSRVMTNKEGGYAPNYTPVGMVDIASGLVVQADVLNVVNEDGQLIPALEDVKADFQLTSSPAVLADGLMATGSNLAACAEQEITLYSPCKTPDPATNPARRDDLTQPVSEADRQRLPLMKVTHKGQTVWQFDKSAFIYDQPQDCYWCPNGKPLPYDDYTKDTHHGKKRTRDRYRAKPEDCATCPMRGNCIRGDGAARRITRDEHEELRERHASHMAKPESKAIYKLRLHPTERHFAVIKHFFGIRQFLLRGLDRVRNEWRWATIAFNLDRIMSQLRCRDGP